MANNDPNQIGDFFLMPSRKKPGQHLWQKKIRAFFDSLPNRKQMYHFPKVLSTIERYVILILAIIALGSLIAIPVSAYYHFTFEKPDYGGTYREGVVGTPQHINPLLLQDNDPDNDIAQLVYSGLMKQGPSGLIDEFDLAESYTVSNDGLLYTFTLKPNIFWHDGKQFTSDDVVFTIQAAQNEEYDSPQLINWHGVEVSKVDDRVVTFKLSNRYAQFMNNMTLGILPSHLWQDVRPRSFLLSDLNVKPIGTGPYKLNKIIRDDVGSFQSMEFIAYDRYHAGKPFISKVIISFYDSETTMLRALNQGKIDAMSFISSNNISKINNDGVSIKSLRIPRYFAIFFNQTHGKVVSEKAVRTALNYATDKQTIVDSILGGKASVVDSPLLPGIISVAKPTSIYEFNPDKAKQILDNAGWKTAVDGMRAKTIENKDKTTEVIPLEVEIITSNWPELANVADAIKNQWQTIGVRAIVTSLPAIEIQQKKLKDRDYSALFFGQILYLSPDPFSFWHSKQKTYPGRNLAVFDDKDADKLLEDARQVIDPRQRFDKYSQLQNIIISNAPAVFLYSPDYLYVQPKTLRTNSPTSISIPSYRLQDINKSFIETRRAFRR